MKPLRSDIGSSATATRCSSTDLARILLGVTRLRAQCSGQRVRAVIMKYRSNRRQFLHRVGFTLGSAFHLGWRTRPNSGHTRSANDRISLGVVGVGEHGSELLRSCTEEQVTALCDVDRRALDAVRSAYPHASLYQDFRQMFDREKLDAVVVATADHTHAVICAAALQSGYHVYCASPLTRTISEARRLSELAARTRCATQVGEPFTSLEVEVRLQQLLQNKTVGSISEVRAWSRRSHGELILGSEASALPATLDFDLWLGPTLPRPYRNSFTPGKWRHWWDFGSGTLADSGAAQFDLIHRALNLTAPLSVEAEGPALHLDFTPAWLSVRWLFARSDGPAPLIVRWHHGVSPIVSEQIQSPLDAIEGIQFLGDHGQLLVTANDLLVKLPGEAAHRPAELSDVRKHSNPLVEWRKACRGEKRWDRRFETAASFTESLLLGNVAFRTDRKLLWDPHKLVAINLPDADEYILHRYAPGWEI